jgi:hypothetical protein
MNSNHNIDSVGQYYNLVDLLKEKYLLTNAIAAHIKAYLRNLSFKDADILDYTPPAPVNDYHSPEPIQLPAQDCTSKNFIHNGCFTQWRYGNSIKYTGNSSIYFADHWFGRRGKFANNLVVSKVNSPDSDGNAMQLLRLEGDQNINEIAIAQLINSSEVINLAGKTVLFGAKVRAGKGYSAIKQRIQMVILCSNQSDTLALNPFSLGKGSQVIGTLDIPKSDNWSQTTIYADLPPTTKQIMVVFRTGDMSEQPATSEDYFELMDVELKVRET